MTFTELQAYMRTHYDGAVRVEWDGGISVFKNRHQRFLVEEVGGKCHVYTYHETIEKKESGQ